MDFPGACSYFLTRSYLFMMAGFWMPNKSEFWRGQAPLPRALGGFPEAGKTFLEAPRGSPRLPEAPRGSQSLILWEPKPTLIPPLLVIWSLRVEVAPGGVQLAPRRSQEVKRSLELQNGGLRAQEDAWMTAFCSRRFPVPGHPLVEGLSDY